MTANTTSRLILPSEYSEMLQALANATMEFNAALRSVQDHQEDYPKKPSGAIFITVELLDARQAWESEKVKLEYDLALARVHLIDAALQLGSKYALHDIPF